jgi:N-formylglutamate deformylase
MHFPGTIHDRPTMVQTPAELREEICHVVCGRGPLVATAIHHGHQVRPEVAALLALDERTRLHEEDPFTAVWTHVAPTRVVVERSRFEVDVNRPREEAVYLVPEQAWGLKPWRQPLPEAVIAASLAAYDRFYARLEALLADLTERHGGFVVYDIHSYNHRRGGPLGEEAPPADNPQVNLGTGNLDRERWAPVIETFLTAIRRATLKNDRVDARENVRFRGGYLSRWVAKRFGHVGCALAIEVKKTFMDEWTGEPDWRAIGEIGAALQSTVDPVEAALTNEVLR